MPSYAAAFARGSRHTLTTKMMATTSPDWPGTPVPNTAQWAGRCYDRLMANDPLLDPSEAGPLAHDMSTRPHWRSMEPERAADSLFAPIPPRDSAW